MYINLLHKVKKPSVHLSVCITLITWLCQHRLKWDLLKINAVSLRKTEFILKSRQKRWFFDRTTIKAKTAIIPKHPWFESCNACFFILAQSVLYGCYYYGTNSKCLLYSLNRSKRGFFLQIKQHWCLFINLAWLDAMNFVVYVLLESIDLMLLKLTIGEHRGYRKLRVVLRHSRLDTHI